MTKPKDWGRVIDRFRESERVIHRVRMGNNNAAKVAAYRLRKRLGFGRVSVRASGSFVVFEKEA